MFKKNVQTSFKIEEKLIFHPLVFIQHYLEMIRDKTVVV